MTNQILLPLNILVPLPYQRIRDDYNPLVVSIETNPNAYTAYFIKTLIENNWDYDLIAIGKPWKGMISKLEYFPEYLQTLNPEKLVILSDSRDVFCVRPPEYFEEAFKTFNKPILVSLEIYCQGQPNDSAVKNPKDIWQCVPLNEYWKYQKNKPTVRRYVNAGLIAGKVKDLIEYFNWVKTTSWDDDQASLGDFMNKFPDKVAGDIHASVLHTSGYGVNGGTFTKNQWEDSPSLAELTGKKNFFLHIPGPNISKGQMKIYNMVKKILIEDNVNPTWFMEGYDKNIKCTWHKGLCDPLPEIK